MKGCFALMNHEEIKATLKKWSSEILMDKINFLE